ncbi:MAG: replicative DNA helicase, partial [Lachnospiraceae bacterium]|nr:replicative DNA helicase [Lachnospiraceae bacterium]
MDEGSLKRMMPHSIEAEQSVIGALFMDNEAMSVVDTLITGEDFYQRQYGVIYDAMHELMEEGRPIDTLTLSDKLQQKDVAPEISSMAYLGEMIANVPITQNAKYYAEIVREKSILRQLIRASEDTANKCYAGKDTLENIMEETEKDIFKVLDQRRTTDYVPIRDVTRDALRRIHEAAQSKNPITGIPTGFTDLDYTLAGLQRTDLILIAARPSVGKTAFALNLAQNAAVRNDYPTAIFSLEMSKEQLTNRLLSMEGRIDLKNLRSGTLNDDEWDKLADAGRAIAQSKLILDDTPGISVSELRTKCRKYKLDHGLKLVIIDYLQLMSGNANRRNENRQQEVSEISRSLKALARELECPVIALPQLSRAVESRPDHHPMLSDLRESGAI